MGLYDKYSPKLIPMKSSTSVTSSSSMDGQSVSAPALRTFLRIADAWELNNRERMVLLGNPPKSTFYRWKQSPQLTLPQDTLERLSYVFGIYKALQVLFPQHEAADQWLRKPNAAPLFGGRSALERILSGQVSDLFLVRQYLDAQRGG